MESGVKEQHGMVEQSSPNADQTDADQTDTDTDIDTDEDENKMDMHM